MRKRSQIECFLFTSFEYNTNFIFHLEDVELTHLLIFAKKKTFEFFLFQSGQIYVAKYIFFCVDERISQIFS